MAEYVNRESFEPSVNIMEKSTSVNLERGVFTNIVYREDTGQEGLPVINYIVTEGQVFLIAQAGSRVYTMMLSPGDRFTFTPGIIFAFQHYTEGTKVYQMNTQASLSLMQKPMTSEQVERYVHPGARALIEKNNSRTPVPGRKRKKNERKRHGRSRQENQSGLIYTFIGEECLPSYDTYTSPEAVEAFILKNAANPSFDNPLFHFAFQNTLLRLTQDGKPNTGYNIIEYGKTLPDQDALFDFSCFPREQRIIFIELGDIITTLFKGVDMKKIQDTRNLIYQVAKAFAKPDQQYLYTLQEKYEQEHHFKEEVSNDNVQQFLEFTQKCLVPLFISHMNIIDALNHYIDHFSLIKGYLHIPADLLDSEDIEIERNEFILHLLLFLAMKKCEKLGFMKLKNYYAYREVFRQLNLDFSQEAFDSWEKIMKKSSELQSSI